MKGFLWIREISLAVCVRMCVYFYVSEKQILTSIKGCEEGEELLLKWWTISVFRENKDNTAL